MWLYIELKPENPQPLGCGMNGILRGSKAIQSNKFNQISIN